MKPDKVYFVPLGGCGMFGCNLNLYGYRDKWIMVDFGMGFASEYFPGIDILLPDVDFVNSLGDDLLGIFITHGHEDHIGAIQYLWNRIKKPIYATKFNMERIISAVSEKPWGNQTLLKEVPLGGTVELGDFTVDFINVAHSIPESSSLAISVKDFGTVLNMGDWQIDENPVEGSITDMKGFSELENVVALIGDSTNVMYEGRSTSERSTKASFLEIFPTLEGIIAVTCFSTNVARLNSIAEAANKIGRKVCLVGRSINKIDEIARKCGYLQGVDPFINEMEAEDLNSYEVVYVCTGSQGERLSALTRIAKGEHPRVKFGKDTTVFFSSKDIPGNERAIGAVQNNLTALGCKVITVRDENIHSSGHPCCDELRTMYKAVKPRSVIPVHGEHMFLEKHSELAKELNLACNVIPADGDVLEISSDGKVKKVDEVKAGLLAVDGDNRIVAVDNEAIMDRRRVMYHGSAFITVVINYKAELMSRPLVTPLGLLDETSKEDRRIINEIVGVAEESIRNLPKSARDDDDGIADIIRVNVRKFLREKFGRNPQVKIHLVRV